MHISSSSSSSLFAAAALTGFAAASPAAPVANQAFSVKQVASGEKQAYVHPAQVLLNVYAKYGVVDSAPTAVVAAASSASSSASSSSAAATVTGSVIADPASSYDEKYYCPLTIGGQAFNLTFDTGSSDLWVLSTKLPAKNQTGHDVYNGTKTGKLMSGYTWDITYGDGSGAAGIVYSDKVAIGSATVISQAVEAATSASSSFLDDTIGSGIIGMGFKAINTVSPTQQNTFWANIRTSLKQPLFAVTLKKGATGTFDFGFLDSSKYTGTITYMDVEWQSGYWELPYGAYQIGTGTQTTYSFTKIVDTGTSLLLLPATIVEAYYAQVAGSYYDDDQGGYVFPCPAESGIALPRIGIRIGGTYQYVPGDLLNWADLYNGYCYGGIQESTGLPFAILGDVFLKAVYAVFENSGTPRVGFAVQANMSTS